MVLEIVGKSQRVNATGGRTEVNVVKRRSLL